MSQVSLLQKKQGGLRRMFLVMLKREGGGRTRNFQSPLN